MPANGLVGAGLPPEEDIRFTMGLSSYVDDISIKGTLYCSFLRSTYAHAKIKSIVSSSAMENKNVIGVYTAEDIDRVTTPIKVDIPVPGLKPMYYHYLAKDKVRWVGDPIAAVVARDKYTAVDALESIYAEYEPIEAVVDSEKALDPQSPVLYDQWKDNRFGSVKFSNGNPGEALRRADIVIEEKMHIQRYCGVPLETRGCIADYNRATRMLTCYVPTQAPHVHKSLLAEALRLPEHRIKVVAPNLGGGFGVKLNIYPEDVTVAAISILLGAPVKWIETRQEHFLASAHSRSQTHYIKMGVSKGGIIKGISDRIIADVGALTTYPHNVFGTFMVTATMLPGPYKIQDYQFEIDWAVTNKTPFGAYRGFGQPECTFVMERLVDIAAKALHMDPVEFRKRNMVTKFPYVNPTGALIDSGSFVECLEKAAQMIGYKGFRKVQQDALREGRHLGVGFACNIETTVPTIYGGTRRWTAHDPVTVRVEPDGKVTVKIGLASIGTSIETAIRQIAASEFGINYNDVSVVLGDTDATPYSSGNYGSRSAVLCGAGVMVASEKIKEKAGAIAAHLLQVRAKDLKFKSGHYSKPNSKHRISLEQIARVAYDEAFKLPKGIDAGLEVTYFYEPPNVQNAPDRAGKQNIGGAITNATHAAVVEVDAETGFVRILKYVVAHDCGKVINPMIVEGQVHGGVAQSIGGTLLEEIVYDREGQLLSSSFMDYLLPTSLDVPDVKVAHIETPSPYLTGGFKGAGEAGTIGVPAAVSNAVVNALGSPGLEVLETPLSPNNVWKLLRKKQPQG